MEDEIRKQSDKTRYTENIYIARNEIKTTSCNTAYAIIYSHFF